jgi:hypothetical protein
VRVHGCSEKLPFGAVPVLVRIRAALFMVAVRPAGDALTMAPRQILPATVEGVHVGHGPRAVSPQERERLADGAAPHEARITAIP